MKIEIKTKNVKNEKPVLEFIAKKIHTALDRVDGRVNQVTVRLEDETKDSNRFDGNCRIEVELHPRGHVHVSATSETAYDCISQAIRKMEHAVKHLLDRHRQSSKARHQQGKREFIEALPVLPAEPQLTEDPS